MSSAAYYMAWANLVPYKSAICEFAGKEQDAQNAIMRRVRDCQTPMDLNTAVKNVGCWNEGEKSVLPQKLTYIERKMTFLVIVFADGEVSV